MRPLSIALICTCAFVSNACGHSVDELVKDIANVNEVQAEYVGFAGTPSENYRNFEKLKALADIPTLLKLTSHSNAVVSCYAGWALIDKEYNNLHMIFGEFLNSDKRISTFSGCLKSKMLLSSEFYHRLWNKVDNKETDPTLMSLDSLIIYHDDVDWLLLRRAFGNRVYAQLYNDRIATLAFEKKRKEAIFYLCNWYRADYSERLQAALIRVLENTKFEKVGINVYYRVVDELFKFKNPDVRKVVISKMRKDQYWKYQEKKFLDLLEQYGVFSSDLKE